MYGTVSFLHLKSGAEEQLRAVAREIESENVPGFVFDYVYQTDSDPNLHILVVGFTDREAYVANANSPRQHAQYLKLRALLTEDPTWHDGEIVYSRAPGST